jgi:hypothetical protein
MSKTFAHISRLHPNAIHVNPDCPTRYIQALKDLDFQLQNSYVMSRDLDLESPSAI